MTEREDEIKLSPINDWQVSLDEASGAYYARRGAIEIKKQSLAGLKKEVEKLSQGKRAILLTARGPKEVVVLEKLDDAIVGTNVGQCAIVSLIAYDQKTLDELQNAAASKHILHVEAQTRIRRIENNEKELIERAGKFQMEDAK